MKYIQSILAIISLTFWTLSGFYIGGTGITLAQIEAKYSDPIKEMDTVKAYLHVPGDDLRVPYKNKQVMNREAGKNNVMKIAPWLTLIPDQITLLILSCCFLGAIGGVIRVMYLSITNNISVGESRWFAYPFFGWLSGIIVVGTSYVFPAAFVISENLVIRPITLLFLSLFIGFTTTKFLEKIENYIYSYKNDNP